MKFLKLFCILTMFSCTRFTDSGRVQSLIEESLIQSGRGYTRNVEILKLDDIGGNAYSCEFMITNDFIGHPVRVWRIYYFDDKLTKIDSVK